MRFLKLSISLFVLAVLLFPSEVFADSTDNFYFSDFTADYYLYQNEDGVSKLKVIENFTTEFPNYDQNKGICRQIPTTNLGKKNVTLKDLNKSNITLLRNGFSEPIYSIENYNNFYEVCTGDETYVRGTQVYTLKYEFEKVITDWNTHQELYWDTNGNGWYQKFDRVTARVHFASEIAEKFDGSKWCYVGKYGESNQERCAITELEDGLQFSTTDINSYENLTFDIQFKPASFVVPPADKNYTLVNIMVGVGAFCLLILFFPFKKYLKASEKRKFYKGFFVKPEFQPHNKFTVGELAEIYIGDKKDSKVAVLLNMIVKKQVRLIKDENAKKKWSLLVENKEGINEEGNSILRILNGGDDYNDGDVIEIKKHTATAKLARIGRNYTKQIINRLKSNGLAEPKFTEYASNSGGVLVNLIGFVFAFWYIILVVAVLFMDFLDSSSDIGLIGDVIGKDIFAPVIIGTIVVTIIINSFLKKNTNRYLARTKKGLEASRFMDGLKLYIKMAEADRMKMLQSVAGVDISPKGIVNLYEKLLPYAAVFGLEKSWMAEMEEYCKTTEIEEPEWLGSGLDSYAMHSVLSSAVHYTNSSSSYSSSSISGSGGFSSGSSGGGGGGFSGGGGGGGGGGGR